MKKAAIRRRESIFVFIGVLAAMTVLVSCKKSPSNNAVTEAPTTSPSPRDQPVASVPGWMVGTWTASESNDGSDVPVTLVFGTDGQCSLGVGNQSTSGPFKVDDQGRLVLPGTLASTFRSPNGMPIPMGNYLIFLMENGNNDAYVRVDQSGAPSDPVPQINLSPEEHEAGMIGKAEFLQHWTLLDNGGAGDELGVELATCLFEKYGFIAQYRNVACRIISDRITEADKLNGIQWRSTVSFRAQVTRRMDRPTDGSWANGTWQAWQDAGKQLAVPNGIWSLRIERHSDGRSSVEFVNDISQPDTSEASPIPSNLQLPP